MNSKDWHGRYWHEKPSSEGTKCLPHSLHSPVSVLYNPSSSHLPYMVKGHAAPSSPDGLNFTSKLSHTSAGA